MSVNTGIARRRVLLFYGLVVLTACAGCGGPTAPRDAVHTEGLALLTQCEARKDGSLIIHSRIVNRGSRQVLVEANYSPPALCYRFEYPAGMQAPADTGACVTGNSAGAPGPHFVALILIPADSRPKGAAGLEAMTLEDRVLKGALTDPRAIRIVVEAHKTVRVPDGKPAEGGKVALREILLSAEESLPLK
jgi:hypothetical protein